MSWWLPILKKLKEVIQSRLGLTLISIFIALFLAELGVRIYAKHLGVDFLLMRKSMVNPQRFPKELRLANTLLPQLRPNAQGVAKTSDFEVLYQTNSKGLRSAEVAYALTPNKKRVVVLGDSFTFGEGIAEGQRFVDIFAKNFSTWEIVNMALPGHGIEHQLVYLFQEGLKYKPELVILFINEVDTQRWIDPLVQNKKIVFPNQSIFYEYLPQSSPGTHYIQNDLSWNSSWTDYMQFIQMIAYREDLKKLIAIDLQKWGAKALEQKNDGAKVQEEQNAETKERATLVIKSYLELSRKAKFKFMVINIDANIDLAYLKKNLPELDYKDLSNDLSEQAQKRPLRFLYDRHFNPQTHRFIGEKLISLLSLE